MNRSSAEFLWWLLPAVRKRKPPTESRLFGFLQAVGTALDELQETILLTRLKRFAAVGDPTHPYYTSAERSDDLDSHAADRGLRRLPGECDAALLDRILTLPYRNRFLGAKAGMKYLIEEIYNLRCEQIVEYYADDQAWIILSDADQKTEVETNLSHLFSEAEIENNSAYRGLRIYSRSDLTQAFHFWVAISNPNGIIYDPEVVVEAINTAKPAHTRAVVYFQG